MNPAKWSFLDGVFVVGLAVIVKGLMLTWKTQDPVGFILAGALISAGAFYLGTRKPNRDAEDK